MDYASSYSPNPGSIHKKGVEVKISLENARKKTAQILEVLPKEIFFTSGGTESNNLAIQGLINVCGRPSSATSTKILVSNTHKPHIITTNIEHPSVLYTCTALVNKGMIELSIVAVEKNGIVDPKKIKKEIKKNTILVSVMYANNEIGTIQPLREIAKEIRHYRKHNKTEFPYFHTDAVQATNFLNISPLYLGVDIMTLSGAKILGGNHVGLLYKKHSVKLEPIFYGGNQEMGLRAGTENTEAIVLFVKALENIQKTKEKESLRIHKLQKYFLQKLLHSHIVKNVDISFNGDLENRLPNNVNFTVKNIPSDLLVLELDARGVYVSSKSACREGDGKASYVIKAINRDLKETDGSLRFSFGFDTKKSDIDYICKSLEDIFFKLKKWYS